MYLEALLLTSSSLPLETPDFPSFSTPRATICATLAVARKCPKCERSSSAGSAEAIDTH